VPDYKTKAKEIAELVERKRKLYGDSFGKTPDFLRILYPDGIRPEQYDDMLTIIRVFDKLCRAATSSEGETESPWDDVLGYALLAAVRVDDWAEANKRRAVIYATRETISPKAPDLGGEEEEDRH
jgi:hypothetical protein